MSDTPSFSEPKVVGACMDSASLSAGFSASPFLLVIGMMFLSLAPLALLGCTCFLKLSVVFSILRSALGAGQLPSAALTTFLSLCLTIFIMSPVAEETLRLLEKESVPASASGVFKWRELSDAGHRVSRPLNNFLLRHSDLRERVFFVQMSAPMAASESASSGRMEALRASYREIRLRLKSSCSGDVSDACALPGESLKTLIPAFALSELKEAFAIGFTLFLPFLVIDLVVANMLVGLGMMMVSPTTVSLPFKLLLFFLCDGWYLLCQSLIQGYM